MTFPNYGTPGSPNLDPYYMTPAQEREAEAYEAALATERRENLVEAIADTLCGTQSPSEVGWRTHASAVVELLERLLEPFGLDAEDLGAKL
jgi:hypothetical protein